MPNLLTNETVIMQSGMQDIVLTNYRIFKDRKIFGKSYYQSIMLEHVTSCEDVYKSYLWILFVSILSFLFAGYMIYNYYKEETNIPLISGLLFLILYLFTRRHLIIISSPGTKLS